MSYTVATHYWIFMIGDHPVGIVEANLGGNARTFFSFGKLAQFSLPCSVIAVAVVAITAIALFLTLTLVIRNMRRT